MAPYRPKSLDELNQAYDKSKEAQQKAAPAPQPMPAPEPAVVPTPMPQPQQPRPTIADAVRSKESAQALSGAADDFVKQFSEKDPGKQSVLSTAEQTADGAAAQAKEELQQETDKAFDDLLSFPSLQRTPPEPPPYHRYTGEDAPIKEGDLSGLMDEYIAVMTDQEGDEEKKHSLFRRRKNRKKETDTLFDFETAKDPVDAAPQPAQEPAVPVQTPVEIPAQEPAVPVQTPVEIPAQEPAAPAQAPIEMPAAEAAGIAAAAAIPVSEQPAQKPKRKIDMEPEPVFDPRRLFFDLDEAIEEAQQSAHSADEPVELPAEEPAEEAAELPVEEPAEEAAELPVEEPAEEAAELPVEAPAEEAAEQPVEVPAMEPDTQPDSYPDTFEDIVSYSDSFDDSDRFTPQPEPEQDDAAKQADDADEPAVPQNETEPDEDDEVEDYQVEVVLRPSKVKRFFKVLVTLLIFISLLASLAVGAIGTILNVNTGKSAFGDYYFFAVSNNYSAVSIQSGDLVIAKHKRPLELQDVAVYVDPVTNSFSFGKTESMQADPENVFTQLYDLSGIPVKEENVLGTIRATLPQCGKLVRMVLADFYTYLGACIGAFLFLLLIRAIFLRKKRVLVSAEEAEAMHAARRKPKKQKQPKEKPQKEKKAKKEKEQAAAPEEPAPEAVAVEEKAPAYAVPPEVNTDLFDDID